jgi:hypothetical protein
VGEFKDYCGREWRKSLILLEDYQASPIRPSDNDSVELRHDGYKQWLEKRATEFWFSEFMSKYNLEKIIFCRFYGKAF